MARRIASTPSRLPEDTSAMAFRPAYRARSADAASAWFDRTGVDFYTNGRLDDLRVAYGFGVRAFVGLPLRIDVAVPTDLRRSYDMHTMFSIGFDY